MKLRRATTKTPLGTANAANGQGAVDYLDVLTLDVPRAPDSCSACGSSAFVAGVLEDLRSVLEEARRYRANVQQLSSQVLTAHEAERKRIARELHDDTAQALTSVLVRLRLLERSTQDEEIKRSMTELRELTGNTLESVRRMALDLRPTALDHLGLAAAIHAFAKRFPQERGIDVDVTVRGIKRRLPADLELVFYRVAQEALTNVAKHARARHVWISLARQRGTVTLTVADDGVGFAPENVAAEEGSGFGLFGMGERMALVRGSLDVQSGPGRGTSITARVRLGSTRKGRETA